MADYHPLIARAVAGLERNTGENRRVLYDRARNALVSQLRSVEPPLDENDVTRERLALEDAIRKVEAEAAQRVREAEAAPPAPPATPSLTDQGLKGFRDNVAEGDGLGDAAPQAAKSARETYETDPALPPEAPVAETPVSQLAPEAAPAAETAPPSLEPTRHEEADQWPPPRRERLTDPEESYRPRRGGFGRLVKWLVILLIIGGIAGAAYWQRAQLSAVTANVTSMIASLRSSTPAPAARETPAARPKITDRVGSEPSAGGTSPAAAPAADVAQKVVLYDEDPNDPQGKRYVGSAVWKTETVSPGPGLAPELAIRADVEIPERHLRMTWSLRRNTDKALPASHTIEILFTLAADFAEGGIQNVPGVLMKQNEQTRGVPLAGLAVKVTNNYFLIGLSAVDVDVQRNIQLLKERPWFDVPIVYNTGKRAIMAVEKGTPGERVFEEAFRAWGQ